MAEADDEIQRILIDGAAVGDERFGRAADDTEEEIPVQMSNIWRDGGLRGRNPEASARGLPIVVDDDRVDPAPRVGLGQCRVDRRREAVPGGRSARFQRSRCAISRSTEYRPPPFAAITVAMTTARMWYSNPSAPVGRFPNQFMKKPFATCVLPAQPMNTASAAATRRDPMPASSSSGPKNSSRMPAAASGAGNPSEPLIQATVAAKP